MSLQQDSSPLIWNLRPELAPSNNGTVVFFPHAGGSAAVFQQWCTSLDPHIVAYAMQYPGRGPRIGESPPETLDEIAFSSADFLSTLKGPVVVVGHSLGAVLSFDALTRYEPPPSELLAFVASSSRGPFAEPIFGGPESVPSGEELSGLMRSWGGLPQEISDHPELVDVLLSPVQSDLKILEQRLVSSRQMLQDKIELTCPVRVFYGSDDPIVSEDDARAWSLSTTSKDVTVTRFSGGHFHSERDIRRITDTVNDLLKC